MRSVMQAALKEYTANLTKEILKSLEPRSAPSLALLPRHTG